MSCLLTCEGTGGNSFNPNFKALCVIFLNSFFTPLTYNRFRVINGHGKEVYRMNASEFPEAPSAPQPRKITKSISSGKKRRVAAFVNPTVAVASDEKTDIEIPVESPSPAVLNAQNAFYKKPRRIAAYCRVSTLMEEQELSYESQCAYYESLLSKTTGLTLVGVYGDQGFSGLHARKRPQFMRLMQDAEEGKIDEVWCKSISRFSRNVLDCQNYLQLLKNCGVRVYFERENIYSDDPQCELILKLLSAAAQEESNSISSNLRWANNKNNENGTPTRVCPYGYKKAPRKPGEAHRWVIDEEKAGRIRMMFDLAEEGLTSREIADRMTEYEKAQGTGIQWKRSTVDGRLRNEAYKGDVLTAKSCIPDFVTGKHVVNQGHVPQMYLKNHHPPIVSRQQWDRVQEMREKGSQHTEESAAANS